MKLFGWGANTHGQLGLGYECEQLVSPSEIVFGEEKVISIAGGAGHSLALTENGDVYSTGWNSRGQLGYDLGSSTFMKIFALHNHKIVQISCGWDFSAAVTETGQAFIWGSNVFLQLGLDKSITHTSMPTLVEFSTTPVKHVSCGMRHLAIIFENNCVWTSGDGSKGQLGVVDEIGKVFQKATVPIQYQFVSVDCGQYHTVAATIDGGVYVWGDNKHGQLGYDPGLCKKILTPRLLNINDFIVKVFAGWTHTALLTRDGEVYNFGRNTYGQLGTGEEQECSWFPRKLNVGKLRCLSLGSEHNLAVNWNWEVLSWGWNEHGNCGTGDVDDKKYPQRVLIQGLPVHVSAGTGQSFAITSE